jgi:hypothetical protein
MSLTRDALRASPAEPNTAWQKAAGSKETAAPLRELPVALSFDDTLDEPIWYDSARKMLRYRGFMCSASYVHLRRICCEPAFVAALEQLYLGSAMDEAKPIGRMVLRIAAPLAALLAIAGTMALWLR